MLAFDFNGALFALSYALDCVEHDLIGVTTNHGKRVAALSLHLSEQLGVFTDETDRQGLSACAILHDSALSEYVQDEFGGSYTAAVQSSFPHLGKHCSMGEASMALMPFDAARMAGAVLYHHENEDGSGPFSKTGTELPLSAKLLQLADTVDARFDLSWMDEEKRERLCAYVRNNTGHLFAPELAEAFLAFLRQNDLNALRNEKIDLHLHSLLPGGTLACTPEQLTDFASVFARITDYKSHFTKLHSIGIAEKAREMARFYGADEALAAELYFAGALHDIGKLVVDREVLEKPDKLNEAEYRHIQSHAYYTYKILSNIPGLSDVTRWAAHHHEKLDGTGYPFALAGKDLGRWERLMACLDIYQALTEPRPYKDGMTHDNAVVILRNMVAAGKLDGDIVRDLAAHFSAS